MRVVGGYKIYKVIVKKDDCILYYGKKILSDNKVVLKYYRNINTLILDRIKLNININHDNILKYNDIIINNGVYLIMDYYDITLEDLLIEKFNYNVSLNYFYQFIKLLNYLYKNNLTKKTIKPQNILISSDLKKIKLCGSFYKSSDENKNNNIWSIGLILYKMIYGKNMCGIYNNFYDINRTYYLIKPLNDYSNIITIFLSYLSDRKLDELANFIEFVLNNYNNDIIVNTQ